MVAALKAATRSGWLELKSGPRAAGRVTFHVQVEEDTADGGFVAICLDLPGCASQGETEHEALENLVEAISGVLEVRMQRHLDVVAPGEYVLDESGRTTRRRALELPVA